VLSSWRQRLLVEVVEDIITTGSLNRTIRLSREYTPVFKSARTEVEEQPNRGAGSFEVIDHLSQLVIGKQVAEGFDLDEDLALNSYIQVKEGNLFTGVLNGHGIFPDNRNIALVEFNFQRFFVDFLFQPWSEGVMDCHGGANDLIGQCVPGCIGNEFSHQASLNPAWV
jgi:hypothetical protein